MDNGSYKSFSYKNHSFIAICDCLLLCDFEISKVRRFVSTSKLVILAMRDFHSNRGTIVHKAIET